MDSVPDLQEMFNKVTPLVFKNAIVKSPNSKVEGQLNTTNYRTPGKGLCYFVQIDSIATKFSIEDIESIEGETITLRGN